MSHQEWGKCPFGCRLKLIVHRLRRDSSEQPFDWEIERGFHLTVVKENIFELHLRPRSQTEGQDTLALLNPGQDIPGADRFLIWQKSSLDNSGWQDFTSHLGADSGFTAGLILSSMTEYSGTLRSYFGRRATWKGVDCSVFHLFADFPPSSFFTVEKNLFFLGRAGRRAHRLARLRRFLPW